jgi:hypothetical protein
MSLRRRWAIGAGPPTMQARDEPEEEVGDWGGPADDAGEG